MLLNRQAHAFERNDDLVSRLDIIRIDAFHGHLLDKPTNAVPLVSLGRLPCKWPASTVNPIATNVRRGEPYSEIETSWIWLEECSWQYLT